MEKFDDIQKELDGLKHIQVSKNEKYSMRDALSEYMKYKPIRSGQKHESISYRFSFVWMQRPMPIFAAVLVFVIGGSTVAAAEGALPGDTLYPIKVSVNEEMRGAFAFSSESKANWNIARAERRLEEAALLAADGNLTEEVREELDTRLEEHTEEAERYAREAEGEERDEIRFALLYTRIETALLARNYITRPTARIASADKMAINTRVVEPESIPTAALMRLPQELPTSDGVDSEESTAAMLSVNADATASLESTVTEAESSRQVTAISEARARAKFASLQARMESAQSVLKRAQANIDTSLYTRAQEEFARAQELFQEGSSALASSEFDFASDAFDAALEATLNVHISISTKTPVHLETPGIQDVRLAPPPIDVPDSLLDAPTPTIEMPKRLLP